MFPGMKKEYEKKQAFRQDMSDRLLFFVIPVVEQDLFLLGLSLFPLCHPSHSGMTASGSPSLVHTVFSAI